MPVRELGHDIWTVDGPDIVFAGARMHTRMTVVRLSDGSLWVHSPITLSDEVREFISSHGSQVRALVAPNKFHYMFVEEWRGEFPNAQVFAFTDLRRKVEWFEQAVELTDTTPQVYAQEIDQLVFGGNRLFEEVVFFHKPTQTLIFTDLMVNLKTEHMSRLARLFIRFEQVQFPRGGVPRLYRWFSSKKTARANLDKVLEWQPKQISFCHGEPFDEDAATTLDREFAWLLN